jgi:hypothetical protein
VGTTIRQMNPISILTNTLIMYTQLGLGVQRRLLYLKPLYHFDCSTKQLNDNIYVRACVCVYACVCVCVCLCVVFNGQLLVFIFPFKLLDYNIVQISVMRPTNSAYFIPLHLITHKMT